VPEADAVPPCKIVKAAKSLNEVRIKKDSRNEYEFVCSSPSAAKCENPWNRNGSGGFFAMEICDDLLQNGHKVLQNIVVKMGLFSVTVGLNFRDGGAISPCKWGCGDEIYNDMLDAAIASLKPGEAPIIHSDRGVHYRWPG
jgi:hypothetical protein